MSGELSLDADELADLTDIHHVIDYTDARGYLPGIRLKDDVFMSVQCLYGSASRGYCGAYTSMEVAYPTEVIDEFLPYARSPKKPTDTIYRYVPVEIINQVIRDHGGITALVTIP